MQTVGGTLPEEVEHIVDECTVVGVFTRLDKCFPPVDRDEKVRQDGRPPCTWSGCRLVCGVVGRPVAMIGGGCGGSDNPAAVNLISQHGDESLRPFPLVSSDEGTAVWKRFKRRQCPPVVQDIAMQLRHRCGSAERSDEGAQRGRTATAGCADDEQMAGAGKVDAILTVCLLRR